MAPRWIRKATEYPLAKLDLLHLDIDTNPLGGGYPVSFELNAGEPDEVGSQTSPPCAKDRLGDVLLGHPFQPKNYFAID